MILPLAVGQETQQRRMWNANYFEDIPTRANKP